MRRASRTAAAVQAGTIRFGEDMSEDELKANVLAMCRQLRLRTAHFRPARTEHGWRTPVEGDGTGFSDLVIVGTQVLWRELKSRTGKVSPDQQQWLDDLEAAGENVGVWRPADWLSGRIPRELMAIRRPRRQTAPLRPRA